MYFVPCMVAKTSIPVIILNWNGIDDTEKCVEHLLNQTESDVKIYLVDNGSDEDNVSRLRSLAASHENIFLRLNDKNLGFTRAHNIVLAEIISRAVPPEFIILLNNDAFAKKDWVEKLVAAANTYNADMVGGKMVNYFKKNMLDNIGHRLLNTAEIIPKGSGEKNEVYNDVHENVGPCAGAALYRTAMLREIGLFDEFFETGYEDAELGVRGTILGYKSIFTPEAIVFHKISQSVSRVRDYNYVLKTQINIFYSYIKLMPWPVLLINTPFIIFKYGLVLLLNLIFGRWFFFRVMRTAIWQTLTSKRKMILESRTAFFKNHRPISSLSILRKMEFFLLFDVKRFTKHMLKRKPTQFEKVVSNE